MADDTALPPVADAPAAVADARTARRLAAAELRRSAVLDAARSAFLELGLEGASLREIARRAGYTPGALYSYFDSKEAVYGALLGESLERLNGFVQAALPQQAAHLDAGGDAAGTQAARDGADAAQAAVRAAACAFFEFYRAHPRDLDLGFYLFRGVRPRGLGPALDARLNARLADALRPVHDGLAALGLDAAEAQAETTAVFAHAVGLLVLGHTGRIRMFGQRAEALFARHLDALLARARAPHGRAAPQPGPGPAAP